MIPADLGLSAVATTSRAAGDTGWSSMARGVGVHIVLFGVCCRSSAVLATVDVIQQYGLLFAIYGMVLALLGVPASRQPVGAAVAAGVDDSVAAIPVEETSRHSCNWFLRRSACGSSACSASACSSKAT